MNKNEKKKKWTSLMDINIYRKQYYYQGQKQYFRKKLLKKEKENVKKEGKMDTRKYTLQFDIY